MNRTITAAAAALVAVASLALTGCNAFDGPVLSSSDLSGSIQDESRDHQDFTGVNLIGTGDVTIVPGSDFEVTVVADAAVLEHIETSVVDGVLRIRQRYTFVGSQPSHNIMVTMPSVESIKMSGAGTIEAPGIDVERLLVEMTGAGTIRAGGAALYADTRVSGAGSVDLSALRVGVGTVTVTGAGDVTTAVTRSLEATITGVGDIHAMGVAQDLTVDIRGAGDFRGEDLTAADATVKISGVGDVHVTATNSLDVNISGLGDVTYYGDPTDTSTKNSGLGTVSAG